MEMEEHTMLITAIELRRGNDQPGLSAVHHGVNKQWRPFRLLAVRAWGDAGCVLADIP